MTIKLYDSDPYLKKFTATVLKCEKRNDVYTSVFDRTAFFPEGGGQLSDTGTAGGAEVTDVQEIDGVIYHYTTDPLEEGREIECMINWEQRFVKMQNHSGEHIVSGLIFSIFGFNNVGFHLGSAGVTVDTDGVLTADDLNKIEKLANEAVYKNVEIKAEYPSPSELEKISYRSKLDLKENVRIVTVEGYDVCACCAPHVSRTGEIGIIKITDFQKYKGGTRIFMMCGSMALEDYVKKLKSVSDISVMLSSGRDTVAESVKRLYDELSEEKRKAGAARRELITLKYRNMDFNEGNICIFEECSMNDLRMAVNMCVEKCSGICAGFSGNDEEGYQYIIASKTIDLKIRASEINSNISGRGGGKSGMIQGNASASESYIRDYISEFK